MIDPTLDFPVIHSKLLIWGIEALVVLSAMGIDLVSGLNKAKLRGEATTSRLLRKSISKFITYEGSLFLGFLLDLLIYLGKLFEVFHKVFDFNHLFLGIPIISTVISIFLVGIEIKSVFEKADQKIADTAIDEFLLLKNLAKNLGPAKLKSIIEVVEETKRQKDEIKKEKKEAAKKAAEERKKKKEEDKLKKQEQGEEEKIAELKRRLQELEGKKTSVRRGRKKKTTNQDDAE
jgi:hypothetical protein